VIYDLLEKAKAHSSHNIQTCGCKCAPKGWVKAPTLQFKLSYFIKDGKLCKREMLDYLGVCPSKDSIIDIEPSLFSS